MAPISPSNGKAIGAFPSGEKNPRGFFLVGCFIEYILMKHPTSVSFQQKGTILLKRYTSDNDRGDGTHLFAGLGRPSADFIRGPSSGKAAQCHEFGGAASATSKKQLG